MVLAAEVNSKYFKRDESEETLGKFAKNYPHTTTFSYSTSARYQGEMLGGFRHGRGKMVWPDGAMYEGEWSYN